MPSPKHPARKFIDDLADELDEPIVVADGLFDSAIIGSTQVLVNGRWEDRVVYDIREILEILTSPPHSMTLEEAYEYFEYNIRDAIGAIVPGAPVFVNHYV